HNENQRPPPVNLPFDPTSPLSVALQRTSWPLGYKPTQLPKYNATTDPTQFLMAYEATIASAGGDDSTMAKSFVMACEGSVANWYSYLPPQSINNWYQLKGRLLQDFQGFRRLTTNTVKDFKCPQHDREPLYDYFRRFVQKKAQIPNFPEKDAIEKCIEGLLPGQLASHLIREPPRTLEELYSKAEKYAKSDADHRRRVEQRRIMRQAKKYNQQIWQQEKQPAQQLILPVEPSQDDEEQLTFDPFIIPPESEPQHSNDKQPSSGARDRGRGRGRDRGRGPSHEPKKFFCHFHRPDSDHRTNQCPEKKTLERMESEKKSQASWAYYMASDSTNSTSTNTVHTTFDRSTLPHLPKHI